MNDTKDRFAAALEALKRERDELRVKLELAKMDAGDEWEKLEHKFHQLEAKGKEVGSVAADASHEIGAAAKLLGEEISHGLKQIARKL